MHGHRTSIGLITVYIIATVTINYVVYANNSQTLTVTVTEYATFIV